MQHAQNDTTTTATTTTATTTTDAPTLTQLLNARAEALQEQQREQARRDLRQREQVRADALAHADTFMRAHVSPALAAALRMTPAVDENALQREEAGEASDYETQAGYLMLDVSGAGLDDTHEARTDPARAERWSLRYGHRRYSGWSWFLHGPNDYAVEVGGSYYDELLDDRLADALADYHLWMSDASVDAREQRRRQRETERQEAEEQRQRERPRHFATIAGEDGDSGGPILGPILCAGNHLMITTLDPRGNDGIMVYSGVLESFTDIWLLLTLDGGALPRAERAQRLIPVARVLDVRPLADVADVLADNEDEETTAAD